MSEHTKEPWETAGNCVRTKRTADGGGIFVADCWRKWEEPAEFAFDGSEAEANARRIVACVNACAGIPDNVLEKAAECAASGRFGTMAAMYKAQRDELLAALQMALADHMTEAYLHPLRDGTVEAIRCAIASAEERGLDAGDKSL